MMMSHIDVGASLVMYGENIAAYSDRDAHTVKLSEVIRKDKAV